MARWTAEVCWLGRLLALVIWVCWALNIHQEINFDIIDLVLAERQYNVILLENNLISVILLSSFIQVIQNFVLVSDQKGSFDLCLALQFIVEAACGLDGHWWRWADIELLGSNELFEGDFLLDWAISCRFR